MNKKFVIHILVAFVLSPAFARADAKNECWPVWRGPAITGVSPDGNPPVKWSETENIKWKVKLTGDGSNSSPVIWQDKLIFQSAVETDKKGPAADEPSQESTNTEAGKAPVVKKPANIYKFNVVCLDRKTGGQIWEKTVCEVFPHEGHRNDHGFASFTPATDGKLIWANFGSRGVYCLDMDGNVKWSRDLGKMNIGAAFGEGGSLALAGDKVIVVCDHENGSFIVALDKQSGNIIWKKDRDEKSAWTTPIPLDVNGQTQIIVNGFNRIRSYDLNSGDVIWQCGGQTKNAIPTPVSGFDMVFCTSGFRGAKLSAIRLGKTGELTGTDAVAWEVNEATPYVPSPLLYGDKIYLCSGNKPIISCYNAKTGQPYYAKQELKEIKDIYASPVGAADKVYFTGRNGVTYVLKNSDSPEILAVNKLDDGIDCSAAIVGNHLYLKGKQYLYCIENPERQL